MIRNVLSLTAASLFLVLASACATNSPQTASPEPAAQPQTAAPAQQPATAPAPAAVPAQAQVASATAPAKKEFHPDDMVCRVYEVTGTRIGKQRICKTRQQWIEDTRAAQENLRNMQNQNAAQPGGDQLITGGTPR